MSRPLKYDLPPVEDLVAFCQKVGATEVANKLGIPVTTLRAHMVRHGYTGEDYGKRTALPEDGLKELYDLLA
jgi:hypothetical protein